MPASQGCGRESRVVIEELAAGWMSLTGVLNSHTMAATLVARHGSEDMRRRLLPRMATGEFVTSSRSMSNGTASRDPARA